MSPCIFRRCSLLFACSGETSPCYFQLFESMDTCINAALLAGQPLFSVPCYLGISPSKDRFDPLTGVPPARVGVGLASRPSRRTAGGGHPAAKAATEKGLEIRLGERSLHASLRLRGTTRNHAMRQTGNFARLKTNLQIEANFPR
jgi:hypothetical protein